MMPGNACWMALAIRFESYGKLAANAVFFAMHLRGFVRWGREGQ